MKIYYMVMKLMKSLEVNGMSAQLPEGEYVVPVVESESEAEKLSEDGKYEIVALQIKTPNQPKKQ